MRGKTCACCGGATLDPGQKFYDICPVCGWEDDPVQNDDPCYDGGANYVSLNEARRAYAEGVPLRQLKQTARRRIREREEEESAAEPLPARAVDTPAWAAVG